MTLKTYVIVNSDHNMTSGQIAAQVAHAVLAMANTMHLESVSNIANSSVTESKQLSNYYKWIQCDTIVILRATYAEINALLNSCSPSTYSIYRDILKPIDANRVNIATHTVACEQPQINKVITAVAFYPGMHESSVFKHLRAV